MNKQSEQANLLSFLVLLLFLTFLQVHTYQIIILKKHKMSSLYVSALLLYQTNSRIERSWIAAAAAFMTRFYLLYFLSVA